MKSIKIAAMGVLALAAASSALVFTAGAASAATTPAYEPDANASNGSVVFYDASGNVITSGNNLSHLFDYAMASTPTSRSGTINKATVVFAFPDHTKPDSSTWFKAQATGSTPFPNAAAPAPLNTSPNPVASAASTDANLSVLLGTTTLDTTPGYANYIEIQLKDSGPGNPALLKPFWETSIQINQAAGTWQQVYPAVVTPTSTTLTASPNPSTVGSAVTLTATETPAAPGSVQFKDGSTNLGSPVVVNGSGVATTTTSSLTAGPHSLSAVFTPTDPTSFGPSTGTFSATVNPPATPTTTTLAVSGGYTTTGSAATLTATVSPSAAPGTVAFYDNGSSTAIPGTVSGSGGTYTLSLASGFSTGGHSVVAVFTPTDVTQYQTSQSAAQPFLTQAPLQGGCAQTGSVCTDQQNIQATIPVGTLVINTPYTSTSPLDLGTLALDSSLQQFTGSATFKNIIVTDLRSGGLPWTVSALASNLTDGGSHVNSVINAQNVGLTSITATPGAGFTGTVTPTDNPAANPAVAPAATGSQGLGGSTPHTVATASLGRGTVTMQGTLTLNAPASTEAGLFTGTITFTVG